MALKGTIRDFGIADIFQLIGQQTKSGVLKLTNDVEEVRVFFRFGEVVRAESPTRSKQMLLGNLLMNAQVVSEGDLEAALREQGRTVRRLGTILVDDIGAVAQKDLNQFVRLQMTETVYRLFLWEDGTYEFEQADVEAAEDGIPPIRADSVLMEGLRMMDEWPVLRDRLPPYSVSFEREKVLPEPPDEDDLGDFFGGGASGDRFEVDAPERVVYRLVNDGVKLEQIIHLSRLGEFEACRAMMTLLDGEYITQVDEEIDVDFSSDDDEKRKFEIDLPIKQVFVRAAVYLLIVLGAAFLYRNFVLARTELGIPVTSHPATNFIAQSQVEVIRMGLEVYRIQNGTYPETLEKLVDSGVLGARDIRHPFENPYYYELTDGRVTVAMPVF